jgi:hypothetical protein
VPFLLLGFPALKLPLNHHIPDKVCRAERGGYPGDAITNSCLASAIKRAYEKVARSPVPKA